MRLALAWPFGSTAPVGRYDPMEQVTEFTIAARTEGDPVLGEGRAFEAAATRLRERLAASPHDEIDQALAQDALGRAMPPLLPIYQTLAAQAGDDAALRQALTGYGLAPRAYGRGVGVAAGREPLLARTLDLEPPHCEGCLLRSDWNGRTAIAMTDSIWGALDGMTLSGLAVAALYPSRRAFGLGFDPALVVRFLLQSCATVAEALPLLHGLPLSETTDLLLVDATGDYRLVHLAPGEAPSILKSRFVTNHGISLDIAPGGDAEGSPGIGVEAADLEAMVEAFADPRRRGQSQRATLYSVYYRPLAGRLELRWPQDSWHQSFFAFDAGERRVGLELAA